MNNQEALDIIKAGVVGPDYHKAMSMAEDALHRQVPALPYNKYYCPVCDFHVGDIDGNHFVYCPMCGQRLDFSELDEEDKL